MPIQGLIDSSLSLNEEPDKSCFTVGLWLITQIIFFLNLIQLYLTISSFCSSYTNSMLFLNSRYGWTQLTNRTMRRAFGPNQSHAYFLTISPPFLYRRVRAFIGSCHVWSLVRHLVFHHSAMHEFVIPFCPFFISSSTQRLRLFSWTFSLFWYATSSLVK